MKSSSDITVAELKELLKAKKLSMAENKAELLTRLQTADPDDEWTRAERVSAERYDEHLEDTGLADGGTTEPVWTMMMGSARTDMIQKEAELYRREKELIERELALAKREIEILRQQRSGASVPARDNPVEQLRDEHAPTLLESSRAGGMLTYQDRPEEVNSWRQQITRSEDRITRERHRLFRESMWQVWPSYSTRSTEHPEITIHGKDRLNY